MGVGRLAGMNQAYVRFPKVESGVACHQAHLLRECCRQMVRLVKPALRGEDPLKDFERSTVVWRFGKV